jgi:hypothetical protein
VDESEDEGVGVGEEGVGENVHSVSREVWRLAESEGDADKREGINGVSWI